MSHHTRGLKRKHAFPDHRSSAVQRIMQEIEAEREKKERLEWYLNEVMKEKEALSHFDESTPAAVVEAFLANSSTSSSSSSTSTSSSSSSSSASSFSSTTTSSSSTSSPQGHTTYLATDFNRWVAHTANKPAPAAVATTVAVPSVEMEPAAAVTQVDSCERCGRQYVESQKTCRCRNFESVKKRQRCLSRFVRTGHMLEVDSTPASATFDLQGFNFIDPAFATTTTAFGRRDSCTDEEFLRMILDDTFGAGDSASANTLKVEPILGEKSQRRRRASFVGAKDAWDKDISSAAEEGYFVPSSNTAVFGY